MGQTSVAACGIYGCRMITLTLFSRLYLLWLHLLWPHLLYLQETRRSTLALFARLTGLAAEGGAAAMYLEAASW